MTFLLVQYTRVQQAASFALLTCSAPIYQARNRNAVSLLAGRGELGRVSPLLVSICHTYQD